ncbi:hypothetical protein ANANG_G00268860 [Anguilla anguilla]|uniref:Atos homolog protein B n=1 Tax=Anguilla anguilla TaxID=7936 RepID=A0A9D3LUP4_ANGAN|nr:hypothetical protein ANANG_G00268860 [Anguilla anguilla]
MWKSRARRPPWSFRTTAGTSRPSAQTGARPGLLRPYGQEEIRLQKVYQLSIFSQLGGLTETLGGQRLARPGLKRALEDWSSGAKRPHLGDPRQAPLEVPVEGGSEQIFSDSGPRAVGHGGGMPDQDPSCQERGGETARSSKSSPPEPGHPQTTSTNGLASPEKTPAVSRDLTSGPSSGPCPAKRRLLSSSDAGESCSEDEGPSTSKRSRLALLAPGLGLGACRSTDAKGAPFWNHLLPSARERPKSAADCSRVGRRLKSGLRLKSRQLRSGRRSETFRSASISRSLLGNFEGPPRGRIDGFTAEIGASGSYCPQHATLPVQVSYYDISEHSAPSPFLGVICLEPLGKKGYSVPKAGTIQVTLFNPNKTVVKMFLVTYNFEDMPVNHVTFLRHRIFLVPVGEVEGERQGEGPEDRATDRKKILCYLIHLRFQSSKSGKIYLHNDIRLLFSRKSIEVDTGIPYELKSYTEVPRNPKYSPRV